MSRALRNSYTVRCDTAEPTQAHSSRSSPSCIQGWARLPTPPPGHGSRRRTGQLEEDGGEKRKGRRRPWAPVEPAEGQDSLAQVVIKKALLDPQQLRKEFGFISFIHLFYRSYVFCFPSCLRKMVRSSGGEMPFLLSPKSLLLLPGLSVQQLQDTEDNRSSSCAPGGR